MTTWQKVRVTFTDADNNEVSAVMYEDQDGDFWNGPSSEALLCVSLLRGGYEIEEIRELPTGVGAVIKVVKPIFTKARDLYCHTGNGWWTNGEGSDISAHAEYNGFDDLGWPYEILSEGIQL